jgi:Ca2+-binding RTX toxin-like protein
MGTIGAYVGNDPADLATFESWLGKKVDNLLFYFNQSSWSAFDSSIDWAIDLWKGVSPEKMIWSVPLVVEGATLEAAATGAYDAHYLKAARALLAANAGSTGPIHIRTGWEFNGDWFPWAAKGHEQAFIGAFRDLVDTFRSVSNRFVFEWTVNQSDAWGSTIDPAVAYPGDDYVDIVGMDFYYNPEWDGTDPLAAWNAMVMDKYGLQWHQDFAAAHHKPTAYSEWGIKSDNAGPYLEKVAAWFASHNVLYNAYWETDMASYPGHLGHYPTAALVFHDQFGVGTVTAPPELPPPPPPVEPTDQWLIGDAQNNTLTGGEGPDYLNGNGGNDVLSGGGGNDRYVVDTAQDQIIEASGGGLDRVESWASSYTLPGWVENLSLSGSYAQTGTGNGLANQITGGSGANGLNGGAGADTLTGGAGNDQLDGGADSDTAVFSGLRSDYGITLLPDGSLQVADARSGAPDGTDRLLNIERLQFSDRTYTATEVQPTLTGKTIVGTAGADRISLTAATVGLRPTEGGDTINGLAGSDTIDGLGGHDLINGGSGTDTIYGGSGDDTIRITASEGLTDIIRAGEVDEIRGDTLELLSNVSLAGFSAATSEIENLNGNNFSIIGTPSSETFDLRSLASMVGLRSVDAGGGHDKLFGSRFSNDLRGGSGNDRLAGGKSNDILTGGSGNDVFVFNLDRSTSAIDRVVDFGDNSGNQDVLDLSGVFAGITSGSFATWKGRYVQQSGSDSVISIGNDKVVLAGVKLSSLDFADFDFVM